MSLIHMGYLGLVMAGPLLRVLFAARAPTSLPVV